MLTYRFASPRPIQRPRLANEGVTQTDAFKSIFIFCPFFLPFFNSFPHTPLFFTPALLYFKQNTKYQQPPPPPHDIKVFLHIVHHLVKVQCDIEPDSRLTWHPSGKSLTVSPFLLTVKLVRWMKVLSRSSSAKLNFSVANLDCVTFLKCPFVLS